MTKIQPAVKQDKKRVKAPVKQDLAVLSQEDENHQALIDKARLCMFFRIVHFNALSEFAQKREFDFADLAKFLGFAKLCKSPRNFLSNEDLRDSVLEFCEQQLALLQECEKRKKFEHKILQENFEYLQNALGLSPNELALLEFVVMKNEVIMFKSFLRIYDDFSNRECIMMLAKILHAPYEELRDALNHNAKLRKSGILQINSHRTDLMNFLDFVNDDFADVLLEKSCKDGSLIDDMLEPCDYGTLGREDYAHLREFDMLENYLKIAISKGQSGVNVLFYGSPGTGKTELAKLLARCANAKIYKVQTKNKFGAALDGESRLSSYMLAQRLLDAKKCLLLYDEVEDILCFSGDEKRLVNKAFINESLESNAVATIWITNNIRSVDSAVIRRFDFVLNVKVPKKAHRKRILQRICEDRLSQKAMKVASRTKLLSPAIIERASKVSACLEGDFSANFLRISQNTLRACDDNFSFKKRAKIDKIELPKTYSLEYINADYDLETIAAGIVKRPNARLCFYGASGTGKSAYAQFIAKKLGRKCLVKPASELLDCYVGNSEKKIAAAFKEAREKNAVLVFDEADSFLRERSLAAHSWEQTLVNEMLVQMESFDGVFIATTNLVQNLDKACLRRFDLKLEFRALTPSQRAKLFEKECEFLGLRCDDEIKKRVQSLENLSSGDFAAVKRLVKFSPLKDALDFYERLADEVKVKDLQNENSRVGFGV